MPPTEETIIAPTTETPSTEAAPPKKRDRIAEIRSDEVQEILSHVPNWMIRWGITLIFLLLGMLLFISWFVKYPDVIPGTIIITTETPPVKLVSQTSGQVQTLYAAEGQTVQQGDFIAAIQNPLEASAVDYLDALLQTITTEVLEAGAAGPPDRLDFNDAGLVFGELQTEYQNLRALTTEYLVFANDAFREKKLENLNKQRTYHLRLAEISEKQLELSEKNMANATQKYASDQRLLEGGAISKMEFYQKEKEYTQQQQELENLKKTFVQNNITIAEYEKQLNDLTYEFSEKERKLKEGIASSVNSLKNFIRNWQQTYVLTAPFAGNVSYLKTVSQSQYVEAGVPLVAIIPENNHYLGQVEIPAQGFGKVKVGQWVTIKLLNYPDHEYGMLRGQIAGITQIAGTTANGEQTVYLAEVALPQGLQTTYNKRLEYKPEMSGTAEIVTEALRLLERVFMQFRSILRP